MTLAKTFKPRLANHARLHFDKIENRYMLLFPEAAMALNETGPEILKLCNGERTIDEIVAKLATTYGASPSDIHEDVVDFLDALHTRKLVEGA